MNDKLKKALKIGGLAALAGAAGYGGYKAYQHYKPYVDAPDNHLGAQGRHMAHNTEAKNKTPWQQRHEDQSPSPSQKEWNSEKAYRRTLMTSTKDNDLAELARGNKSIPINRPMTNSKYLLKKDGGVSTLGLVKSAIEHPEHLKMNL